MKKIEKQYKCPVTGQQIYENEKFINFQFAGDYSINFRKIGDSIVYAKNSGNMKYFETEKYNLLLDDFIRVSNVIQPFVEIRDYTDLYGRVRSYEAIKLKNILKNNELKLAGFINCNAPTLINILFKTAVKSVAHNDIKFDFAKNYKQAVEQALSILENKDAFRTISFDDLLFPEKWQYKNPDNSFEFRNAVIAGKLFISSFSGKIEEADVEKCLPMLEDIYKNGGIKNSTIIKIGDYSDVKKASAQSRKMFSQSLKQLNTQYNCIYKKTFVCGAGFFIKSAMKVYQHLLNQEFVFVNSVQEAFDRINYKNIKKKKKTKQYVKVKQQDIQEIINFCGNLLWEEDEKKAPVNFSAGSALNDTKSALELLRDDFNELRRKDREQSQNLMNIFESMQVGIVIIEKSTHKIVFANTMAVEMMQTKIDDLIGKKCHTHLCPGQEGECPITDLGKTVENAERILRKSDGTEIQILKNVRSIEFQNTQCLLESFIDISVRKKEEKLLIEREQQLRELNATKDKFFSIIGHDLRSPFNSIIGFSELINKEAKGLDISEIENYAGIISSSAGQTLKLLNNLLEWARIQQGRIVFEPEQLVLNELTKEVLEFAADSAGKKSISLINSVKPGISVNADKNMLKTILRNLVSNAIKFTHTGGKVEVSAESKEKEIQVSVSDTGVGIKQENIKELFRIDSEFSTQGTNNEKGTGLGLILCKEFVEKHGGKIGVESKEGKGSTFNFSLPY